MADVAYGLKVGDVVLMRDAADGQRLIRARVAGCDWGDEAAGDRPLLRLQKETTTDHGVPTGKFSDHCFLAGDTYFFDAQGQPLQFNLATPTASRQRGC